MRRRLMVWAGLLTLLWGAFALLAPQCSCEQRTPLQHVACELLVIAILVVQGAAAWRLWREVTPHGCFVLRRQARHPR